MVFKFERFLNITERISYGAILTAGITKGLLTFLICKSEFRAIIERMGSYIAPTLVRVTFLIRLRCRSDVSAFRSSLGGFRRVGILFKSETYVVSWRIKESCSFNRSGVFQFAGDITEAD